MRTAYRTQADRPCYDPPRGLRCPWCGQQAMGRLKKSMVGRSPASCASCNRRVSLAERDNLDWAVPAVLAHVFAIVVPFYSLPYWALGPAFLLGYGASVVLHSRLPLVRG